MTRFTGFFLHLPRPAKRALVLLLDAMLCVLAVWIAYYLRLGEWVDLLGVDYWRPYIAAGASLAIAIPLFIHHGLYRAIFRHSGLSAFATIAQASAIYAAIFSAIFTFYGVNGVPRTIGLIQPLLLVLLVGLSRALFRYWLGGGLLRDNRLANVPRVLIYGAGSAGRQLADAMANSPIMKVTGFLDDSPQLQGQLLNNLPIFSPAELPRLVWAKNISTVLLALPSTQRQRRNEILAQVRQAKVAVRTLPTVTELAQGKVSTSDLRELDIDDLLGRDPVAPNNNFLERKIAGKVVAVTGAGGSIGSELCRQIIDVGPATLLLIEQSEFALYQIHQELEVRLAHGTRLVPLLASVRDAGQMRQIVSGWRPHTIYHAAAYKHVPLVEHNVAEGVRNNVSGTLTLATLSAEMGVADMVLISTDKAVRPTNVMGASKRLAEMVLQALAATAGGTTFSMVRFGNVLGSSGSVVPKFRQQIRDGGPITLTHPDITRYFMTIPEAAQLVIQAGAMASGGDVFVLDMGQSVRILDLARRMVELSGLTLRDDVNPEGDIAIEITGLRPGEKLFEELLIGNNPQSTSHPRIMKAHEDFLPWVELQERIAELLAALERNDISAASNLLQALVTGYCPSGDIVDWLYLAGAP